ncbi:MAG: 30S ribosomal protein S16 [Candidatus Melainabacteria bacterium]|nr:30S ribosomal protein S16 [Candidatus Melainabacteria bacterium]
MMLKIRLRQQGRTNRQTYRLVVTDIREPRGGKYIEMIGWYNPFSATLDAKVDADRVSYWVALGAEISPRAQALIARIAPDVMKEIRAKEHARQVKKVAKRRGVKKAAAKTTAAKPAAAAKPAKKAAAKAK